jgi:mRNA-degrading endonuclease RelE of RelBE toxin-antitoxin system
MRPNPVAPWELRIGKYRVFYEIIVGQTVRVLTIGHKEHNDLFIRGERVEI